MRQLGRSKNRRENNIEMELKKIAWGRANVDWVHRAQN